MHVFPIYGVCGCACVVVCARTLIVSQPHLKLWIGQMVARQQSKTCRQWAEWWIGEPQKPENILILTPSMHGCLDAPVAILGTQTQLPHYANLGDPRCDPTKDQWPSIVREPLAIGTSEPTNAALQGRMIDHTYPRTRALCLVPFCSPQSSLCQAVLPCVSI